MAGGGFLAGWRALCRSRVAGIYALLLLGNVASWGWAILAFRHHPVLLGTALLAYSFGLRHAVDADHIAAIDNVTRKLMQEGRRPVGIGCFFSLGHSTVVVLASLGIALGAGLVGQRLGLLQEIGGVVGTLISAGFLFILAALNALLLWQIARTFRRVKAGLSDGREMEALLQKRGFLFRLFRPLFGLVQESWHMYPLGFLFGLGFDTATEIGVLGISAAQATQGLSIWSILVFPALFTAGMSLVDTTDGVLMLGAYGWAFVRPVRKLYYNMTITFISVLVAVAVGGVELLGLVQDRFALTGRFWDSVSLLNGHFGALGYVVIGIFVASWAVSFAIYRLRGYDRLESRKA